MSSCKIYISIVSESNKDDITQKFKNLLGKSYLELDDIFVYALQYTPKNDITSRYEVNAKDCLISVFDEIYINSDCSLGFCCKDYFDEINFGSLLKSDFLELYNGNDYKKMRQQFIDNSFEKGSLCYNCLAYEGLHKKVSS